MYLLCPLLNMNSKEYTQWPCCVSSLNGFSFLSSKQTDVINIFSKNCRKYKQLIFLYFSTHTDKTQMQKFGVLWIKTVARNQNKTKQKILKSFFYIFADITGNYRNEKQDLQITVLSFQLT